MIDRVDFDRVRGYPWISWKSKSGTTYVVSRSRNGGRFKTVYLHRFILDISDSAILVDHKDRDGLNNRRKNLRIATRAQNSQNHKRRRDNTSGRTGVSLHGSGRWRAEVKVAGKPIYLGLFRSKAKAIEARVAGEEKYYGEFAP